MADTYLIQCLATTVGSTIDRRHADPSNALPIHQVRVGEVAPAKAHSLLHHSRSPWPLRRRHRQLTLHTARNTQQLGSTRHPHDYTKKRARRMHSLGPPAMHANPLPTKRYEMRRNYVKLCDEMNAKTHYYGLMPIHNMPTQAPATPPPPCNRMRGPAAPLALPRPTLPSGRVGRSPHAPPPLLPMRVRGKHLTPGGAH